ncbi:MAG: glycosyltransferase family 2 protein [Candidatus Krumholzibacteriota bacterium]|nr:glycosyltransferase family 2 protein [Candidatus Krumholzibacteriota bacterium]
MKDQILDVIILNWNGEDVIGQCLESLEKVKSPPLRITVVDNASTDSSVEMIRERFPEIELLINDSNLLFAEGNNVGIRKAMERGGQYILLLNNDTEVDPDFARRMMEAATVPGIGIVGPKIYFFDDSDRIWYGGGEFFPGIWIPKHKDLRKRDSDSDGRSVETGWVTGCAMLVRREVFEDIGLLDRSYRIYCEDIDFCLRAKKAGWKCYYEESARVWHKVSSSSGGGMTPFKLENRIASTNRLFIRFRSLCWRLFFFPAHLLIFLSVLGVLLVTGRWALLRGALRGAMRVVSFD